MKRRYLLLSGMAVLAMNASAQILQEGYVEWPVSSSLHTYINTWQPGQELFPDENFFISRVKPKTYFRNAATQVYETLNEQNDKKLLFWVPVTYSEWKGFHVDALPNGEFDSEVFSLWPYVTHYGDWTSPFGWVPGGFADAAHKHGTAVSGVASVPNASLSSAWSSLLYGMGSVDKEKAAKFLLYHGVDGLGYNSEWTSGPQSIVNGLNSLHGYLMKYMADKNPVFENIWYGGVKDGGHCSFDDQLGYDSKNIFGTSDEPRTSLFLNYNWNTTYKINTSVNNAASWGRDLRDVYAGMNMQGGCKTPTEWLTHLDVNYSIGLWGAHNMNYLWEGRNANGSAPTALQATYQKRLEQWFTNGARNPIAKTDVYSTTSLQPSDTWFGMSRYMTARSTLSWDLADEPFVTFFNLGNGQYFNYRGERQHNSPWYNIGIQDYMPTWRFWQADKFLGNNPENIPADGLDVAFSWDDAYMGGSSLHIGGSTTDEYLHLFKTQFQLATNDVITIRYKMRNGSADISLALSMLGQETELVSESDLKVVSSTDDVDDGAWIEKTFVLKQRLGQSLKRAPIAMVALHIQNAKDLDLYLGEFSICRGTYMTPQKPNVTGSTVLANNYKGLDGKIIFNMPNNKAAGEPCYNLDVNTSFFRIYFQQEGGEIVNMGATTSWAALIFAAPYDPSGSNKVRFGVSAVNLDYSSESEIAWTAWQTATEYKVDEAITISKSTIKPGEDFEIGYTDAQHAPATWTIYNSSNQKVAESTGDVVFEVANGLPEVGSYDVVVNEGKEGERRLASFIQVSAIDKGALPRILSLAVNDTDAEEVNGIRIGLNETAEFSYTGREADGFGSRGIEIGEKQVGVNVGNLGLQANHSFSVAAWVRLGNLSDGTYSFMSIENRAGTWPKNNWGFFWSRINQDGQFRNNLHDGPFGGSLDSNSEGDRLYVLFPETTRVIPQAWTHVCYVFEYNESRQIRYALYVNGIKQTMTRWMHASKGSRESAICGGSDWNNFSTNFSNCYSYGDNETETGFASTSFPVTSTDWILFGSTSQNINAMNATIDNLVIWNKAVTDEEVTATMNGLDPTALPDDVLGFWNFDNDCDEEYYFANLANNGQGKACKYELVKGEKEGQGIQHPMNPDYTAGCPFLDAKTYAITTLPTWTARKGNVVEAQGNDTEGTARISYDRVRDYTVSLTLENALGSDTREYPVVTVADLTALESLSAGDLEVYTCDRTLFVDFAEEGNYVINVYNAAGALVNSRSLSAQAGQKATITIANPSVYVVAVTRDGKTLRNVKVVVR
ncbi:MAG: hypothetical protein NC336_09370 [Clostridium sp.]|nr:hypothetical protein [Clostridium sp.]